MRAWLALSTLLLALPLACQRLPGEEDDDDGPSSADTTGFATLLPGDGEDAQADDDESGASGACDPVAQLGCPPGEKCTAILSGGVPTYTCASDAGGLDPESPCTASTNDGIDGCPAGSVCLEDEAGAGLCAPLCGADADCDQGQCTPARLTGIPYCADDCSPFESPCPSPLQCRRNGDRFSCMFLGTGDVGASGEPCGIADDAGCAPGFVCLPGALIPDCASDNCCASLCDTTEADSCLAPAACAPVLPGPAPGFEEIGACFVPS